MVTAAPSQIIKLAFRLYSTFGRGHPLVGVWSLRARAFFETRHTNIRRYFA